MSEKRNCDIVQDLIPLEMDGVCTEGSKEFLQEHIGQCESCRRLYDMARKGTWRRAAPAKEETALALSMKAVGKKLHIRRILLIFLSIVVLMYGGIFTWNMLMQHETTVPLEEYSAYVYAEEEGHARVLAEMPYFYSEMGSAFVRHRILGANDADNRTGEKHAYIIEIEPKYCPFQVKLRSLMGQSYSSAIHLPAEMEIKDGQLYTSFDSMDGYVPGVPISEIRLCSGEDYRVIYTWGNDVLTYDATEMELILGETRYSESGVTRPFAATDVNDDIPMG